MRLELALVVGILLFCSWCAYIVARMSWSVNAPGATGQITSGPDQMGARQQLINHTNPSQGQILIDQFAQLQFQRPPTVTPGLYQAIPSQQQARQFEASEPVASRQLQHWAPQFVGQQQQQAARYSQPVIPSRNKASHWQAHSPPPTTETGSRQTLGELEYYDESPGAGQSEEMGVAGGPEDQGDAYDGQEPAETATNQAGEGDAHEDQQDYDDYERPQPPVESELEEVSNRRSFSELQSDSRERDKDGRLVQNERRHLINGRPVVGRLSGHQARRRRRRRPLRQPTRRSGGVELPVAAAASENQRRTTTRGVDQEEEDKLEERDADEDSYDGDVGQEEAPSSGSKSESDFEGMVREIDLEDRLQRAAAAKVDARTKAKDKAQARSLNATGAVDRMERRSSDEDPSGSAPPVAGNDLPARHHNGTSGPSKRPADGADSHQHRVQETFVATKWDDETPKGPAGAEQAGAQVEELSEQEDEDQVGNIVERDREAQQLEGLARRALTEAARVPDELEQRRRRKREAGGSYRRADGRQTSGTESLPSRGSPKLVSVELAADENDFRARNERHRRSLPPDPGGSSGFQLNPGSRRWEPDSGNVDSKSAQIVSSTPAKDVATKWETGESPGNRSLGLVDWRAAGNGSTRAHVLRAPDSIGGSEDMHVAVLADPPPLADSPAAVSQWPAASNLTQPPAAGASQPHVWYGDAALLGGRHLALGSHELAAKRRPKARRRKAAKKKRSRVSASKYNAARAYANKQKRRVKKGDMRKKRRKSHKHSMASRKQFEGLTRGKKQARGHKLEGAKKKSALVKDKGYKKRGFKKSYHKLETGDHKTYFDEFRDKDHKRRWKDFDDKHKYSQKKKWAGYDSKHHHGHKLDQGQGKASKLGKWRERSRLDHSREANKYKERSSARHKKKVKRARKQ